MAMKAAMLALILLMTAQDGFAMSIRGSAETVERRLDSVIPPGTPLPEVRKALERYFPKSKVDDVIRRNPPGRMAPPIDKDVYAILGVDLGRYRGGLFFLFRIDVVANFYFDENDRLVGRIVYVQIDSL